MAAFCVALLVPAAGLRAQTIPAKPTSHVMDLAGIMDRQHETRLNSYLVELGEKTTANIVVLTVNTTGGEPIEQFAIRIANDRWRLGQKGKSNGLLVVVAVKDRKYRTEIGSGLMGILPDTYSYLMEQQYFVPNFRAGNFGKGIYEGVLVLANKVAQDYGVQISGMPAVTVRQGSTHCPFGGVILLFFIFSMVFGSKQRTRRGARGWFWPMMIGMSIGRGFGGGGGFGSSGGGFGSFGGGFGGGFSGGGSSGSW